MNPNALDFLQFQEYMQGMEKKISSSSKTESSEHPVEILISEASMEAKKCSFTEEKAREIANQLADKEKDLGRLRSSYPKGWWDDTVSIFVVCAFYMANKQGREITSADVLNVYSMYVDWITKKFPELISDGELILSERVLAYKRLGLLTGIFNIVGNGITFILFTNKRIVFYEKKAFPFIKEVTFENNEFLVRTISYNNKPPHWSLLLLTNKRVIACKAEYELAGYSNKNEFRFAFVNIDETEQIISSNLYEKIEQGDSPLIITNKKIIYFWLKGAFVPELIGSSFSIEKARIQIVEKRLLGMKKYYVLQIQQGNDSIEISGKKENLEKIINCVEKTKEGLFRN